MDRGTQIIVACLLLVVALIFGVMSYRFLRGKITKRVQIVWFLLVMIAEAGLLISSIVLFFST